MFKNRLRSARIFRGYTLQKTADALGLALRTYQKYEGGDREPNLSLLTEIADLFDVPTDFLLGRDDYLSSLGVSVDVPPEGPPRHPKPQKSH
ncbi:helix-turn-helix transcriptional regulator [Faecalicatena contorta]|uniref:helix-turn-helix domain-containing protein n=1 Tax=Faecalicatena contorta TaxID=39482 RepID=UPI0031E0935D|nr:helix-turn-helix transcriptional regulator [Clostridium sp.]